MSDHMSDHTSDHGGYEDLLEEAGEDFRRRAKEILDDHKELLVKPVIALAALSADMGALDKLIDDCEEPFTRANLKAIRSVRRSKHVNEIREMTASWRSAAMNAIEEGGKALLKVGIVLGKSLAEKALG